jgi:hypothetical protein
VGFMIRNGFLHFMINRLLCFSCFFSLCHAANFYFCHFIRVSKPHKLIVLKMKTEIRVESIQLREHGPYLRQCVLLAVAEIRDVATVGCVWWEINDVVDGWRGAWK